MKRALVVAVLVAASSAALPAAISDPVRTDAGLVSGTTEEGVRVFKGIPFAAPPVGPLRFREPQPVAKWEGVRRADQFGTVCVQPSQPNRFPKNVAVDLPDSPKQSEDCLYLNVWTTANAASERRPVMVWIYGGAYTEGSGSSPHNDGKALAKKGVVLVSFNYRLGPFGFYSHPELDRESGHDASGNQAVMDCIAALRWVQANITAFGGDPKNVTIFGESAGAALGAGLTGTPMARGLFQRAISESGAWMGLGLAQMRTRAQAETPIPGRDGAPPVPLPSLMSLRAMSTEEVSRTIRGAGMITDGYVIPEDESLTFAAGRQNPVDVLAGSNKDEGAFQQGANLKAWTERVHQRWRDLTDEYLKLYPAGSDDEAATSSVAAFRDELFWQQRLFADAQARIGRRAWVYFFSHEPATTPGQRNVHAVHTAEIPYVFNNLKPPRVYPDNSSPEIASMSKVDIDLADRVSSYWVNFARAGDPNGKALPTWPPFKSKATGKAMILGPQVDEPTVARMAMYDKLYERQMATLREAAAN